MFPDSFIDPDLSDKLTYTAEGLPETLQFDPEAKVIKGKVDSIDPLSIKIIATDPEGLSVTQDVTVKVNPSLMYIINWLLQILGPLVSVISAIKYRFLIYLYFYKEKYIDQKEENIRVG